MAAVSRVRPAEYRREADKVTVHVSGSRAARYGKAAVFALMLVLTVGAAAEQTPVRREGGQWVEETYGSVAATPELVIVLPEGSVVVSGGDQPRVTWQLIKRTQSRSEAEARRRFQAVRVASRRQRDRTWIEGQKDGGESATCTELNVVVPRSTRFVKLIGKSGGLRLAGFSGAAVLKLGAGSLNVDQVAGPVLAEVGMGTVDIGSVGADLTVRTTGARVRIGTVQGRITAESGGGNITIDAAGQGITARTSSGDIQVGRCGGELTLDTGGGSLELGQVAGKATLHSAAGNIRVGQAGGPVTASTGGGKITLWRLSQGADARVAGGGQITAEFVQGAFIGSTLQTPSGDVVVYINPALRTTVQAIIEMAAGHRLETSFPEVRVTSGASQDGVSKVLYAEGKLNGGGPALRVRTTNGNVIFRRAGR